MPRTARYKSQDAAFYHLYDRVAGGPKYFPFKRRIVARKFISLFEHFVRLYCCRLASLELMDNHYHSVVYFEQFRKLDREELHRRARLRFGRRWKLKTRHWDDSRWEEFNRNLFDVSRFMQHVNGEFSKWFNRRSKRRGPFWAGRFKSPILLDPETVRDTILYNELNATRAGVVQRPEDYRRGSAYWRWAGKKTDLLIPLEELFPAEVGQDSFSTYRAMLYHRGAVATKDNQAVIPEQILRREQKRGFGRPGAFSRRLRFFTDGVAIGGHTQVAQVLEHYRNQEIYTRRKNPIPQLAGALFTLREQRSHAFSPG